MSEKMDVSVEVSKSAPETTAVLAAPVEAKKIANRLKRARGQLDGLISAFESGAGCRDVVTQLAAVSKALDRAGFLIVSTAMQDCLREPGEDGDPNADPDKQMDIEELEKLFYKKDSGTYIPHITMVRNAEFNDGIEDAEGLKTRLKLPKLPILIDKLVLFESLREDEYLVWGFVRVTQLFCALTLAGLTARGLFGDARKHGWQPPYSRRPSPTWPWSRLTPCLNTAAAGVTRACWPRPFRKRK